MAFPILGANQGCVSQPIPMMPAPIAFGSEAYAFCHPNMLPGPSCSGAAKKMMTGKKRKTPPEEQPKQPGTPQRPKIAEDVDSDSGGDWNSEEEEEEEGEGIMNVVPNPTQWAQPRMNVPQNQGYTSPGPNYGQFLSSQSLWTANYQPQRVRSFSCTPGMKVTPQSDDPIDYFLTVFNEEMFNLILEETNHQGQVLAFGGCDLAPNSEIHKWKPLTRPELDIFLGLLYLTGHVQAPSFRHYWQNSLIYNYPQFQHAMTRNRFLLILRVLHFARNPLPGQPKPSDPLYKIKPLFDLFHKQMGNIFYPCKELCMDEPMVLCQGNLFYYNYVRNRRQKYDLKFYTLTQPNGLVLKTRIYCGLSDKELGGKGHVEKVAKHLLSDFLGVGHSVFMDSYFTGLEITEYLLNHSTYVTGTLKANRRGNPLEVINKNLKQLEVQSAYTANGICVMKWRNKRDIIIMSSEYSASMAKFRSRIDKLAQKPQAVIKYNENMTHYTNMDPPDQLLTHYPAQKKKTRWYAKAAIHMFHVIMHNAYLLHKTNTNKKLKLVEFRDQVITALIYRHCAPMANVVPKQKTMLYHTPTEVPRNDSNRRMKKRCPVCKQQGLLVTSSYYCNQCPKQPGLCLEGCFAKYHGYEVTPKPKKKRKAKKTSS